MEIMPPLPSFDNLMEVTKTYEIEIESEGQVYLFVFTVNLEVTYDPEANEIVIQCTEEQLDNIPGN